MALQRHSYPTHMTQASVITLEVIMACRDCSRPDRDLSCCGRLLVILSCSSLLILKSLFIFSYTSL